jgi:uncharacterized RDD family membrane protein YckC
MENGRQFEYGVKEEQHFEHLIKRIIAFFIDSCCFIIFFIFCGDLVPRPISVPFEMVIVFSFVICIFWCLIIAWWGTTIGKKLMKLSVERSSGEELSYGRGVSRALLVVLFSFLAFYITIVLLAGHLSVFPEIYNDPKIYPPGIVHGDSFSRIVPLPIGIFICFIYFSPSLFVLYIPALFNKKRALLHDMLLDTIVIFKVKR